MQRKVTSQSRGANSSELAFRKYTKYCDCVICGNDAGCIVHHCKGSTFRHNKVFIGHWFILPLCLQCDNLITLGGSKLFRDRFGTQSELWLTHAENSGFDIPENVIAAIIDWNR